MMCIDGNALDLEAYIVRAPGKGNASCLFFERLEIARERIARAFGQRDEDAAAVMRIGLAHEKTRVGHRLDPAQRRSRRNSGRAAQARHRDRLALEPTSSGSEKQG